MINAIGPIAIGLGILSTIGILCFLVNGFIAQGKQNL